MVANITLDEEECYKDAMFKTRVHHTLSTSSRRCRIACAALYGDGLGHDSSRRSHNAFSVQPPAVLVGFKLRPKIWLS